MSTIVKNGAPPSVCTTRQRTARTGRCPEYRPKCTHLRVPNLCGGVLLRVLWLAADRRGRHPHDLAAAWLQGCHVVGHVPDVLLVGEVAWAVQLPLANLGVMKPGVDQAQVTWGPRQVHSHGGLGRAGSARRRACKHDIHDLPLLVL